MNSNLAFIFPGQGSQSKGMLVQHLEQHSIVAATFTEASDVLGYDMKHLVLDDSESKLDRTEYTQPALLTASVALLRLWRERSGAEASHVAGHSLGEYSALVAAGVFQFSDAVSLVAFRGRAMTEAVAAGVGRMAAILGLEDAVVGEICSKASDVNEKVWPANYNCPGQLVIAGHAAAVDRAMSAATEAGAKRALPLAVSAPSHTPLMQAAADRMREELKGIAMAAPSRPVWSNALAAPLDNAADIRKALVEQLVAPVRWTESVERMRNIGISQFVEMGPGKVLAGLVKRIERDASLYTTLSPESFDESIRATGGASE